VILGLGPIGDMAARIARHRGAGKIIGIDLVPERLQRVRNLGTGVETLDLRDHDDIVETVRHLTHGRGPDSVIDAVGMEAHGSPVGKLAQTMAGAVPKVMAQKMMEKAGLDRLAALHLALDLVRRGGTVSLVGVYGGQADPMPMLTLFDKQVQIRMGQANVKRWVDDLMPLVTDDSDPLGVEGFATHRLPLADAPQAYEMFQKKKDGAIKILFTP
jgi:threonine dehydrogenase-like Zn-dependent dehydrogenase